MPCARELRKVLPISYMEGCRIRSSTLLRVFVITVAIAAAADGYAATYYVRSGGDDAEDGRSHDTAWRTLSKVNAYRFASGDRVLFYEGNVWTGQLVVDWAGTAETPVIVGAYYLAQGEPVRGFRAAPPVIDGEDMVPEQFDGLVRVKTDYVRVENLSVVNSRGRGIQFEDADYGVVADCETRNSYKSGIKFVRSQYAVVQRNSVTRAGRSGHMDGGTWGGAIELVASNDGLVRDNRVVEVHGEGINANHGSTGTVIQDNYVFGAQAVGIYVDAAPNTTVRRNIVVGTSNSEFWRTSRSVGAGIVLNNESYHYAANGGELDATVQSRRAKIYGNLVSGTAHGLGFWGQLPESTFDDVMVFNNTFVENETQLVLRDKPKSGSKFLNNILLSIGDDNRDVDRTSTDGMVARSNYFSRGTPGGDITAPNNVITGLSLARMTGWRAVNQAGEIDWQDFQIRGGSRGIGAGDSEPRSMSQGDNRYDHDYNDLPHNSAMDLGGLHYSDRPIKTPKKPDQIRATP